MRRSLCMTKREKMLHNYGTIHFLETCLVVAASIRAHRGRDIELR
jgi:hypothetical protein